jgi:PadR family transcriptional regulator, regulatory protein AphA
VTTVPDRELTPTSYIVLGLLEKAPGTPYDLKARVAFGVGNFWTLQHAQLYSETSRLAEDGLLDEERESTGRRRKTYSITETGRAALRDWLKIPVDDLGELRDHAMLKVFFGAEPKMIAAGQAAAHKAKLDQWEALKESFAGIDIPEGARIALDAGLVHERGFAEFWASLL